MSLKGFLRGTCIAVLVIFLVLHTAVQLGRDVAVQWLLDQGASSARIYSVSINWFTGRITLQGVSVITPEQPELRLDKLVVDLDYSALTEQRILISDLTLEGITLYLHEQPDTEPRQFFLGPVALPGPSPDDPETTPAEPSAWQFGLAHLSISDFSWRSQLQEGDHQLRIDNAELDTFYTWQEDAITNLSLAGAINGAGFNLNTQGQPLPETKRSELHLKLDHLPLHPFTAPFVPELQATLTTDLQLTIIAGEQISITQHGSVQVDDFNWQQTGLDLSQQQLNWNGQTEFKMNTGKPESVMVDGELKMSALGLIADAMKLQLSESRWRGRTDLSFGEAGIQQVGVKGQLDMTDLGFDSDAINLTLQGGGWQGDTRVNFGTAGIETVGVDGQVNMAALNLEGDDGLKLQLDSADWQGTTGLNFNPAGADKVDVKGQLKTGKLLYQMAERLQADVDTIDWQGGVALALQQQPPAISGENGQLALNGVEVKALQGDQQLVTLNKARFSDISLALPEKLSLGGLDATGLALSPQAEATLATLNLKLSDVGFVLGKALTINRVELQNLQLNEQLSADKQPVNVTRLQQGINTLTSSEAGSNTTDSTAPTGNAEPALRVRVNELLITGDSKVMFADNGTSPPFNSEILIDKVQLQGLDTGSQKPATFDLGLKLNSFTTFTLSGDTDLAGGGDSASWKGDLKQLELPRLSPYSIEYTGYYLQNGQLQLNSSGKLSAGKISGKNQIKIHRLEVEPADQEQMAAFSKKLSMPLGTAVSILQDGDDNIDLDVPISGSLEDPDFGLQSVVTLLAGKGLKQAAFSILLKSLQPYGTLISLAASAAKDGSFITLNPIVFAPGSAELNDDAVDYLAKIESMMTERKGMRLNICGQAVQQDQTLIRAEVEAANKKREKPFTAEELTAQERQRLVELAQQRADRVKQQLTDKIPGERLFSCFPVPSLNDPQAKPSATLGL
ncbi:DUF748 domain-containing protein [uncultured Amphritea sp.]|uniref:DUF748 domain-containing protein n=1 Tax=uncultured Amphritea sp. TaxID=981605 RepID=UPI0026180610|nr:DUF748 domain-containing protein [uncultured Amphritea sp.]